MYYVKEMSRNIYQDELASLSSKVNEFSFKAPPTVKSLEETGLLDNPPNFNTNIYMEYIKRYYIYVVILLVVLILLFLSKPYFIMLTVTNDNGEDDSIILSYKKLFFYTILISLPLMFVFHIYIKKQV